MTSMTSSNSSILNINSDFGISTSLSSSNFEYNIGQAINIKEIVIKNITIPNTAYNVTLLNNIFSYRQTIAGTVNITVPIGNYTIITLLDTIKTLSGDAYTWGLNPVTGIVEFTWLLTTQIFKSGIGKLIGLAPIPASDTLPWYPVIASLNIIMPYLPNMIAIKNYYICSRTLAQGVNSILVQGANLPIIAIVPNSVAFGSINHYASSDSLLELKVYTASQNLQYIDIQIRGDDGRIVDLNGSSFQMNCLIYRRLNQLNDYIYHK